MKPINLKALMAAYETFERAKSNLRYERDIVRMGRWPSRIESAETQHRDAKAAFAAECDRINKVIHGVEGKSTARTATAEDLASTLCEINEKLNIPKKHMNGIVAVIDKNAQSFPNAYKYQPKSTQFMCEFKNGTWRLYGIFRDRCCNDGHHVTLTLTKDAEDAIIRNFKHW